MAGKSSGNSFKMSKEKRDLMIKEIQAFFLKEREEEIGELAAYMFLEFMLEKIAPEFYNQGVYDCYKYMNEKTEDMLGLQK